MGNGDGSRMGLGLLKKGADVGTIFGMFVGVVCAPNGEARVNSFSTKEPVMCKRET